MPKHDLHQMEHMVANLFNLSLSQFQSGNHLLISAAQFLCLPYELALMLVEILARILWILPYAYFHPNHAQDHAQILEHWHQHLSLYQRLQHLKNHCLRQDWKQKLPHHTQALDLLHLSLEQQTLFLRLPRLIKTAKPKPQASPPTWSNLKKHLAQLPLPTKPQALTTTIDTLIQNPVNQYQSVFTTLEEIILIMEHEGILPYFREYPLLASLGLIFNFTTFLSFHLSIQTLPWVDKILVFLKQTNAAVGHAFFGQIIDHDLIASLATCFLSWQMTLFSVNLTQKVIAQEDIEWIKHLLQHQDSIVLTGSMLMLIGYVEAMLPLLPSQIRISDDQALFNPLFALINFIHLEAKRCRRGQLPFSSLSLGIFGLKTSLFFLNLASSPATMPQPYPAKRLTDTSDAQKNLIGLLLGIYHHDDMVVHALSHPPIAKTYFLNLVQELKAYDKDFSIDKYPLLQQFYALYCQKRGPNILRLLFLSLFPLHLLQWAYGHYKKNIEQIISARHYCAEDLYLILEGVYLIIHPIILMIRIIIDYLLIPILSLGLQCLSAVLPAGKIKEQVFQLEDKLSNCNIQTMMIQGLRPVQVLIAKLAFNAGIFPHLGPQTEYLIEKIQEQKTQVEDLGSVIKFR